MPSDDRVYIRLDVHMPDNPKIEQLSATAFRLLITVWCRCGAMQTDGRVSDAWWKKQPYRARQELISSALVVQDPCGWRAHDYLSHQLSRDEIRARKAARAQAGRAGGLAKARAVAKQKPQQVLQQNPSYEDVDVDVDEEVEERTSSSAPAARRSRARTTIPASFEVTLQLREWARANGIECNLTTETQQWHDYHTTKGDTAADWTASWRYWMRNTKKYGAATKTKPAAPVRDW